MEISEIILVSLAGYFAIKGFAYCKAKGKTAYSLLIPIAMALFITLNNMVFRYRMEMLDWPFSKYAMTFAGVFAIMAVCMTIPMGIAVLASKVKARKNEKSI